MLQTSGETFRDSFLVILSFIFNRVCPSCKNLGFFWYDRSNKIPSSFHIAKYQDYDSWENVTYHTVGKSAWYQRARQGERNSVRRPWHDLNRCPVLESTVIAGLDDTLNFRVQSSAWHFSLRHSNLTTVHKRCLCSRNHTCAEGGSFPGQCCQGWSLPVILGSGHRIAACQHCGPEGEPHILPSGVRCWTRTRERSGVSHAFSKMP